MSTNKTTRYKMHSPTGTDKVSRQELNDNFDTIDSLMVANSTADTTYYVNASSGNDANDGLSAAKAFQTIQKAISLIPQVVNHSYKINVAAGTYNEDVAFNGFSGRGTIYLIGDTVGGNEASFNVKSIYCHQTQTWISIVGFTITGKNSTNGVSFLIDRCRVVNVQSIKNTFNDTSVVAFRVLASVAKIVWCTLSNKETAIQADLGAIVYAENNSGSGNTNAYMAVGASFINMQNPMPGGANQKSTGYGGNIGESYAPRTSGDITIYVSTNGNDRNDGSTTGTALRNIQTAINRIPQIVNHVVNIYVAAGSYNEGVILSGFYGRGSISVIGDTVVSDAYSVTFLDVTNCGVAVNIRGLKATTTSRDGFMSFGSIGTTFDVCRCSDSSPSFAGISFNRSTGTVSGCNLSNRQHGIVAQRHSKVFSYINTGSGNTFGIMATEASEIGKFGSQPAGGTAETAAGGGVIR